MNTKPISPKTHALIDYALVLSLLTAPSLFHFNKKVKQVYAIEGLILLLYIASTDTPVGIKPLIPFSIHGKIDRYNVAQFAVQSFTKPFRKTKKILLFNIAFTIVAGALVALTDFKILVNHEKAFNT